MQAKAVLPFGLGAIVGATGLALLPAMSPPSIAASTESTPLAPLQYDPSRSLAPLVEKLAPAVVNLEVSHSVNAVSLGRAPFSVPDGVIRQGMGSGFFISSDGYLITNNHVVEGARAVTVHLEGGRELPGEVVGTDPRTDLALVKVQLGKGEAAHHVTLGDSDAARVGDWVVAIGAPFGLDHSVTAGIISAKGRVIGAGPYDDFLQTDASINPGNSGGPLFNLEGEVVGVNTAINPRGQGIGFSVPSNVVKSVVDELKHEGRVARGWMGVGLRPLTEPLKAELKVTTDRAAVVSEVYEGTPAAKAGLRQGDVLLAIDGEGAESTDALIRQIGARRPGETLRLSVSRAGAPLELTVVLAERPDEDDLHSGAFLRGGKKGGER